MSIKLVGNTLVVKLPVRMVNLFLNEWHNPGSEEEQLTEFFTGKLQAYVDEPQDIPHYGTGRRQAFVTLDPALIGELCSIYSPSEIQSLLTHCLAGYCDTVMEAALYAA